MNDNNGESQEWGNSPGYIDAMNSPFKTPVSAKGGRTYNKSKVAKEGRFGPQTPISNAGEKIFALSFVLNSQTIFFTALFDEFLVIGNNLCADCNGDSCFISAVL